MNPQHSPASSPPFSEGLRANFPINYARGVEIPDRWTWKPPMSSRSNNAAWIVEHIPPLSGLHTHSGVSGRPLRKNGAKARKPRNATSKRSHDVVPEMFTTLSSMIDTHLILPRTPTNPTLPLAPASSLSVQNWSRRAHNEVAQTSDPSTACPGSSQGVRLGCTQASQHPGAALESPSQGASSEPSEPPSSDPGEASESEPCIVEGPAPTEGGQGPARGAKEGGEKGG